MSIQNKPACQCAEINQSEPVNKVPPRDPHIPRALRAYRSRSYVAFRDRSQNCSHGLHFITRTTKVQVQYIYMYSKLIVSILRKLLQKMIVLATIPMDAICAWHRKTFDSQIRLLCPQSYFVIFCFQKNNISFHLLAQLLMQPMMTFKGAEF